MWHHAQLYEHGDSKENKMTDHFDAPGDQQKIIVSRVAAQPQLRKLALKRRIGQQTDFHDAVVEPHPVFERILDSQGHRVPLLMQ
jgi:hypothetical protein